ncbi:Anaphase-promoting complex subunit 1 [Entomophthora muscae]|uniref:Anaphase-promoting complex subunit 1 n=1 Tax=Entomophthora muscae TaxID=34485 RepID=A0ACC2SGL9_9FUNG|nr:Anaphase-promoting complex subunit 1 [Entomophthora muscae]
MGALENLGTLSPFGKKYLESRTSDTSQIKVKRQRTIFLPKNDQHTIYCAPTNPCLDEELFISKYVLVHSRGERLIRALSFDPCQGTIRFAFWASLSILPAAQAARKGPLPRTLCVFFEDSIQCYCETGETYPVHLPFFPKKAWPLGNHVLIQSERVRIKGGTISKFYTLTHPLEGVKPITESYAQKSGIHPFSIEALLGRGVFEIVHIPQPESELPFLVFFHKEKQKHSIWKWSFKSSDLFKKPKLAKSSPENSRLIFDLGDIEVPPEPQLSLELIWEEETSSGLSSRTFFLKHQEEALLCLVVNPGKMNCYRFNEGVRTSAEIFSTKALDAIPVSSFRETSQEVLFLSLEGNFFLWPGLGLKPVPIQLTQPGLSLRLIIRVARGSVLKASKTILGIDSLSAVTSIIS